MDDNDKKPNLLKGMEIVMNNLKQPSKASASNIREVNFKNSPDDIVQTLGADTDAVLITYERDKGELKLYHNGVEIDKAVFAKVLKAETSYYALFDFIQEKFKSWRDAWVN